MRKKRIITHFIVVIALVFFIILGLASATAPEAAQSGPRIERDLGIYNQNIPVDQLVTLEILGGIRVREFNGVTVGDSPIMRQITSAGWGVSQMKVNDGSSIMAVIRIPAGSHTLLTSFYVGNAQQHILHNGILLRHDFIAGHTYRLTATISGKDTWGRRDVVLNEWNLGSPGQFGRNTSVTIDFRFDDLGIK